MTPRSARLPMRNPPCYLTKAEMGSAPVLNETRLRSAAPLALAASDLAIFFLKVGDGDLYPEHDFRPVVALAQEVHATG